MQDVVTLEEANQAIRLCESNGLNGTAEALKEILLDLRRAGLITQDRQTHNVAET